MWPAERRVEAVVSAAKNHDTSDHACINEEVNRNLLCMLRTQRHGTNVDSFGKMLHRQIWQQVELPKTNL